MLGTLGRVRVHSAEICSSCFSISFFSVFVTLRLERRASAAGRLSERGAPTCLTEAVGMDGAPLLGGTGGLEEECLR